MGADASPLALETADIGILKPDLLWVLALVRLERVTRRRIRENLLVFAVLYNDAASALISLGVLSPVWGLLRLLVAQGIGSEVQRPLATVVVFGLSSSTLLTVFLIPVFYR